MLDVCEEEAKREKASTPQNKQVKSEVLSPTAPQCRGKRSTSRWRHSATPKHVNNFEVICRERANTVHNAFFVEQDQVRQSHGTKRRTLLDSSCSLWECERWSLSQGDKPSVVTMLGFIIKLFSQVFWMFTSLQADGFVKRFIQSCSLCCRFLSLIKEVTLMFPT